MNRAALPNARVVGNAFEQAARREKVARLVNVLDRACVAQLKLDPIRDAAEFADRLECASTETWVAASQVASVNYPSSVTRAAVVEAYRERARLACEVAS